MIQFSSSNREVQTDKSSSRDSDARAYEAAHNRALLLRLVCTLLLLAIYHFSGASLRLAEGLQTRFGEFWWIVNIIHISLSVFLYLAVIFPLSMHSGFLLEQQYDHFPKSFGEWILDYIKVMLLEVLLVTILLSGIYACARWQPASWWIWAAIFYVLYSVFLVEILPVLLFSALQRFDSVDESDDIRSILDFVKRQGVPVSGVSSLDALEGDDSFSALLSGLGRTRRIVLAHSVLDRYTQDEIMAVLAHEVGHYKNRDFLRLACTETVFALIAFFLVYGGQWLIYPILGFSGAGDVSSLPVLSFLLLGVMVLMLPLANAAARQREFAADAYAVRTTGSAGPLISALEKFAEQTLTNKNPSRWTEMILHNQPSIFRRIQRARQEESHLK